MANIKSQKKRALTNAKANKKNSAEKSQLKTAMKKVNAAVVAKDKEAVDRMSVQARNTAESHSSKYFAEKVLDVYKIALKGRKLKKGKRSFWSKMFNVFKRGLKK